jgi:hypothetical protein
MAARPLISLISLILLAGGILLQFLVILSGTTTANPENQIYFLEASTNGIPNARNPSRWTFFSICGVGSNGRNTNCGSIVPALPFDPPHRDNFATTTGVPDGFIGQKRYFYLSRFMFAFYLVALFFAVCALFTGLLALCARLAAKLSGFNTFLALFFQALAAGVMTAWVVEGRNAFRDGNLDAKVGVKAMAFTWVAFGCYFLSTVFFCLGGRSRRENTYGKTRGGVFGRKKSTRSTNRGSFIGSERGGIKDDYS